MPAPLTPFELSGRTTWTPLADEQAYVDSLLAYAGDRLTYRVVGQSVKGNPLRLFTIGTGPRVMLWTSHIHGNEPVSREVMYTTLRTWVDSTDPALLDYLSKVTVVIMPTLHPDDLTTRDNSMLVNVNRDFVRLSQPETRTIASVFHEYQPDVHVDWHEFAGSSPDYQTHPAENSNIDPALNPLSQELDDAVVAAIQGEEWSWQPYSVENGPDWCMNNSGVRGSVSLLLETPHGQNPAKRHDMHMKSADVVWRWHAANVNRVRDAVEGAKARAATRTDPVTLEFGFPSNPPVLDPVPDGYFLTVSQWQSIRAHRETMGLTATQRASGYYVPTAQRQRALLSYVVDPQSAHHVTRGLALDAPPVSPPPVAIGDNVTYRFRWKGKTHPATLKVKP